MRIRVLEVLPLFNRTTASQVVKNVHTKLNYFAFLERNCSANIDVFHFIEKGLSVYGGDN